MSGITGSCHCGCSREPQSRVRVAGIILAAGLSSRMGQCKSLLPLEGKAVISHVADAAVACSSEGLDPIVVVLGAFVDEIRNCLEPLASEIVDNPDYASGMASSIKAGLDYIIGAEEASSNKGPCTGALFILGDQPRVPARVFTRLIRESASHPGRILIPTFEGERGNPVLFDRRFFPELQSLSGDVGGRALFDRYPELVFHVPVSDAGICQDLDTWADYEVMAGDRSL